MEMSKHKWWHFIFTQESRSSEHSTSYCGKYLWHHFDYVMIECAICNECSLRLKDYKNDKLISIKWKPFTEVNQAIKDARK